MMRATEARFLHVNGLGMGGQGVRWILERWALRRRGKEAGGLGLVEDIELIT